MCDRHAKNMKLTRMQVIQIMLEKRYIAKKNEQCKTTKLVGKSSCSTIFVCFTENYNRNYICSCCLCKNANAGRKIDNKLVKMLLAQEKKTNAKKTVVPVISASQCPVQRDVSKENAQ